MARLSVITLALNEEHNIEECLRSVSWADERVVIDSGSTDRTVEYARRQTPLVYTVPWEGYGETRNRALEFCSGDWVLWLDADERVTPELAEEIQSVIRRSEGALAAYDMPRLASFLGRWIRHAGWYPGRSLRLFRRDRARFNAARVHEQLLVDGPTGHLRNDLLHYTDRDLEHYFGKFNRYTTLAAEQMYHDGRRAGITDLVLRPPFMFMKMYFLRLGMLDGVQGLILCVVSSLYVFVKYAKLWHKGAA